MLLNYEFYQASYDVKLKDLNILESCTNLKELYLSECHQIKALGLEDRPPLNFPNLEVLNIAKCDNLERLHIHALKLRALKADNNVKLKELHLSECHQIQVLEDKDGQYLNFPNLEILHIDRCDNLKRLKINAPRLQILKANNNDKLKD